MDDASILVTKNLLDDLLVKAQKTEGQVQSTYMRIKGHEEEAKTALEKIDKSDILLLTNRVESFEKGISVNDKGFVGIGIENPINPLEVNGVIEGKQLHIVADQGLGRCELVAYKGNNTCPHGAVALGTDQGSPKGSKYFTLCLWCSDSKDN